MVIKKENSDTSSADDEPEYGVVGTYKLLWRIIQLPAVVSLIVILLTVKVGHIPFLNKKLSIHQNSILWL